jgi:hypothetical protein
MVDQNQFFSSLLVLPKIHSAPRAKRNPHVIFGLVWGPFARWIERQRTVKFPFGPH